MRLHTSSLSHARFALLPLDAVNTGCARWPAGGSRVGKECPSCGALPGGAPKHRGCPAAWTWARACVMYLSVCVGACVHVCMCMSLWVYACMCQLCAYMLCVSIYVCASVCV